jgi:hypothetical protein
MFVACAVACVAWFVAPAPHAVDRPTPQGSERLVLYEGTYDPASGRVVLPANPEDWVAAGFVIATATGSGRVEVTVKLESDDPRARERVFDLRIVPEQVWGSDQDCQLTTNRYGTGVQHFRRPAPPGESAPFRIRLLTPDTTVAYVTAPATIDLKLDPGWDPRQARNRSRLAGALRAVCRHPAPRRALRRPRAPQEVGEGALRADARVADAQQLGDRRGVVPRRTRPRCSR